MKGFTYKTTAVALQSRRLVTVSRKGGAWRAVTTAAGEHYLRHGTYPGVTRASRHGIVATPPASVKAAPASGLPAGLRREPVVTGAGQPAGSQTIDQQAEGLVVRVIRAGGVLEISTGNDRTDYARLCKAAMQAPSLPSGKQLRARNTGSWSSHTREVYFDEDFAATVTARPVPVPDRVATYHPAVAAYRADADHQEVSKDSLGRASRILQALAAEAIRRGYTVTGLEQRTSPYNGTPVRSFADGQLRIGVGGFPHPLRIRERSGKSSKRVPYGPQRDRLPLWTRVRQTEFLPTGELRITIGRGYA